MDAMSIRRAWMEQLGLSELEIEEFADFTQYPATLEEELDKREATKRIMARQQERRA